MKQALLVLLVLALSAGGALGHELRPAYLELREAAPETYAVLWKVPARGDERRLALYVELPAPCTPLGEVGGAFGPDAYTARWRVRCPGGLAGQALRIRGLEATLTDVLVRVQHATGPEETHLLRPPSPSATIRGPSAAGGRAVAYVRLGVEHILLGADHLLFVLALVLITRGAWPLVKTVTAFTVSHSLTLAAATLGYARIPEAPVNAVIALSILCLGAEVVRAGRGKRSLSVRRPWLVAFAFGLLHGFGFASGLAALGLPRAEVPAALLLFNVGVEAGQVGFVALMLALGGAFRVLEIRWPRLVAVVPAYAVGSLGAFWAIQRAALLLGAPR
jgi:hydrogenase/urease accessory protein HupE